MKMRGIPIFYEKGGADPETLETTAIHSTRYILKETF